jgi:restriction system protein
MSALPDLTLDTLKREAKTYAQALSSQAISALYGVTDGKAVGTYVEQGFRNYLHSRYMFVPGNAAQGIDFPELLVDLKVTSINQPQSSCPFRDAHQKVYGLGYGLLVMVYDKADDAVTNAARLNMQHVIYIDSERTADYQTTFGILEILRRDGNVEDVAAFLDERNLPLDEIGRDALAKRIMTDPPKQGYLTISNALQWRLQYSRAITIAGKGRTEGLENV